MATKALSIGQRLGLDRSAVGYGLRLALEAWLAFAIAAHFHIHHAYWAAMPIWVVSQATRGLLLERGLFRIIGTLLGAGFGFALLHVTDQPYLQLAIFGLWIAVCSALTQLLRGVHTYGALMAGITAAVVVIPSVLVPAHSIEIAVARVECTLIGVAVVLVVQGLFTPGSERQAFYQRVRRLSGDAVAYAAATLRGQKTDAHERQVLADISDVEASASLVSAGSVEGYRRLRHVHGLVRTSLAVMAASRVLHAHQSRGEVSAEGLAEQLTALAESLQASTTTLERPVSPPVVVPSDSPAGERFGAAIQQLKAAEAALFADPNEADAKSFGRKTGYLAPYHDWSFAKRVGLACGGAALVATTLGYASGWPPAMLAAIGVCIFPMILSGMPLPQLVAPKLLIGVICGVIAGAFYRFMIQPQLGNNLDLVLSLAPFMLIGSLARASSKFSFPALEANMCFMLSSQAGMPPTDAAHILTGSGALLVAAGVVSTSFILLPRRPHEQMKEVARRMRLDLSRMMTLDDSDIADWHPHTARQILRLMVHLGRAGELGNAAPRGLLSALNLGQAVADLRAVGSQPAIDSYTQQNVVQALNLLRGFAEDPTAIAGRLEELAIMTGNRAAATAMRDAADALRPGASLFRFGLERTTAAGDE